MDQQKFVKQMAGVSDMLEPSVSPVIQMLGLLTIIRQMAVTTCKPGSGSVKLAGQMTKAARMTRDIFAEETNKGKHDWLTEAWLYSASDAVQLVFSNELSSEGSPVNQAEHHDWAVDQPILVSQIDQVIRNLPL